MGEHIGVLPLVMVSPGDIALVSESGEERRRLSNAVLSQMSPEYLNAVQNYSRLLLQRNAMLKNGQPDWALMDIIDARMESYAAPAHAMRAALASDLSTVCVEKLAVRQRRRCSRADRRIRRISCNFSPTCLQIQSIAEGRRCIRSN